jgi:hypothetical protein
VINADQSGDPGYADAAQIQQSFSVAAAPTSPPPQSTECDGLRRLLAKLKRQRFGLAHRAHSARKHGLIGGNIRDTHRRIKKRGC